MSSETLTLRPSLLTSSVLLILSIAFTYIGYLMISDIIGWFVLLFFGFSSVVLLVMMIPNSSYLKLTKEGFEIKNLFRKNFIRWSEVDFFEVANINGFSMVCFNYSQNYQKYAALRGLSSNTTGFEAGLPNNYGKKPEELAKLMNEWKERYAPNNTLNDQMANYNYNYNNMGNS